ncbi:hypothetical protein HZ326_27217 [Fusarium oxysporum f. sp. albedinis]|nr:hypothetical protein HZ326_27217 [Fusarium oxysporum f. sp. albedinis]
MGQRPLTRWEAGPGYATWRQTSRSRASDEFLITFFVDMNQAGTTIMYDGQQQGLSAGTGTGTRTRELIILCGPFGVHRSEDRQL